MSRLTTKPTKMTVRLAKTQISLGIRPVWSESSLCAQWVAKEPTLLHADSKDSDQTGRMPRLIWIFAGRTVTLLILSCRGSHVKIRAAVIWLQPAVCLLRKTVSLLLVTNLLLWNSELSPNTVLIRNSELSPIAVLIRNSELSPITVLIRNSELSPIAVLFRNSELSPIIILFRNSELSPITIKMLG